MNDDILLDAKTVGQFAVTSMGNGQLHATRIAGIYPPNTKGQVYCDRVIEPAPYQCVALEGVALVPSRAVLRVLATEIECRLFETEEELKHVQHQVRFEPFSVSGKSFASDLERLLQEFVS